MRHTLAVAHVAIVCAAEFSYQGYTKSDVTEYLKENWEPEY
jgi:hypothetical protein